MITAFPHHRRTSRRLLLWREVFPVPRVAASPSHILWVSTILTACVATTAGAQPLPDAVDSVLREAKPDERETIENVLKRLYPERRDDIDRAIDRIEDDEKKEVAKTHFLGGWTGEGAIGSSLSTGNSDQFSFSASLDVKRKGPRWEHRVQGDLDIQNVEGERSKERLSTEYRARRDFRNSSWFLFGSFAYEHDGPQGISRRFTEALGPGYQIFDTADFDWEVSVSPALRHTRFADGHKDNRFAAYLATDIDWDISGTLNFSQKVNLVLDEGNWSAGSDTSLTTNIYGDLSARLSFTVNFESDPPDDKVKTDTSTRLSLVLSM